MANYTLTTGADWIVGTSGDDTFYATAATLNYFDRLAGGGGTDTLALYNSGAFYLNQVQGFSGFANITLTNETSGASELHFGGGPASVTTLGSGSHSIHLGAGATTIHGTGIYGYDEVLSDSWTLWNAGNAIDSVDSISLSVGDYDLTTNTLSNIGVVYASVNGSSTTVKINSADAAGVSRFAGSNNSQLVTADTTLDLSHTTVSGFTVTSTNGLGTTFTVGDLGTALQIAGGSGQDSIVAQGFNFTAAQRDTIFHIASIETIVDASGAYHSAVPGVTGNLASDTGLSSTDKITSNPTLTGTGEANAVVHFTVDGNPIAATATIDAWGAWAFTPTGLANGTHTVVASQTDAAGNSTSTSLTFTLDTTAPAITTRLANDTGSSSTDKITSNPTLTGTGDANAVVHFTVDGNPIAATATADASGAWTFTPTGLANGTHTVVASETDAAGNSTSTSLTFTLDTTAPAITARLANDTGSSSTDKITSNPTLTGAGDANAVVHFTVDGNAIAATATADASGAWTFTPTGLANGTHTVVASETDAAGNSTSTSLTFTLDTTAPAITSRLANDTGLSSTDKITSNPTLTGTGEANAVVHFTVDGNAIAGTATANASGTWTFIPTGLADGSHTIVATTGSDTAGNVGTASLSFTLDKTAAITARLANDTGSSSTDKITSNPTLTGAGDANAVVHFTVDGNAIAATATADASGAWTFTPTGLVNGTHTVVASETDAAGNSASTSLTFTLDKTAPAITARLANDTGSSSTDKITSNPTLTGTGDPNAVIHFTVDGNAIAGTATANASGAWTFTPTGLTDGSHTIVATETDAAGNTGSASLSFTLATGLTTTYFPITGDAAVDVLTSGYKWVLGATRTVDYSISNGFSGEYWNAPAVVAQYVGEALNTFSQYADIHFNYVGSFDRPDLAAAGGSEINVSLDGSWLFFDSANQWAVGNFPNNGNPYQLYSGQAGDVYLNLNSDATSLPSYEPGSQGRFLFLHELGHTLGLKHTHDDGGTGRPTFQQVGLLDKDFTSIMSYEDDAAWNQTSWDPATPMAADILALQYLYGKNMSMGAGDTSYFLQRTNDYRSIWDASGIDTINASQSSEGWVISLPNQALSTLVDTKVGYAAPVADYDASFPTDLVWLLGDYENVTGSNFSDTIVGNSFGNVITGGLGNDVIDGGDGFDVATFGGARAAYQIWTDNGAVYVSGQDGVDVLTNVEQLAFSDTSLLVSELNNILSIAATNANRVEGQTGTTSFTFTVTRSGNTSLAASAIWAVTGSGGNAAAASDFAGNVLPTGTVSFAAGETSVTITVQVAGDMTIEADEGFRVTLSDPTNGWVIGTASADGLIRNDDAIAIETSGAIHLGQLANKFFLHDGSGNGPSLKYAGTDVVAGQFGGWTPIGAEKVDSGYQVVWKNGSADQYIVWNLDSTGNWISQTGVVSGSDPELQNLETVFQQDLNADGTTGPKSMTPIETSGATRLDQVANQFFLHDSGGIGPSLKFQGTAFTAGQFGAWTPVGVEKTASGYQVAWKNGSADQYIVWNLDSNGNWTSQTRVVSGSEQAFQSLETTFQQDLNADGTTGLKTTPIETSGETRLDQVANQLFLHDSGGIGPSLKYQGTAFTVGQFRAWTPIGAEKTGTGYQVVWKNGGADQYITWNLDSTGNWISQTGVVSGSDPELQNLETVFQQDLNADGMTGPKSMTPIETSGATRLDQVANQFFLHDSGGIGPSLKFLGTAFTAGQFGAWTPVGVEKTASGYQVAWKNGSADQYIAWNLDSNGNYLAQGAVVSGSTWPLQSYESVLQQDLNSDGTIGLVTTTIESEGSTSLVQIADNYFLSPVGGSSGPQLKYGGAAVTVGQFAGWTAFGAEATANGYLVAWKNGPTGQYTVWNTDISGNYVSNDGGAVSGSSPMLQSYESAFHQDLNGDGTIGFVATLIESSGSATLVASLANTSSTAVIIESLSASQGNVAATPQSLGSTGDSATLLLTNYMASTFAPTGGEPTGGLTVAEAFHEQLLAKPAV